MSTPTPESRRQSLLATLFFQPNSTATVRVLAREMGDVHNIVTSHDQVRGDLTWLGEQGFVRVLDDMAQMTERGRDVARGNAPWPGH